MELRDGDPSRYGGLGCRRAVGNVVGPIAGGAVRQVLRVSGRTRCRFARLGRNAGINHDWGKRVVGRFAGVRSSPGRRPQVAPLSPPGRRTWLPVRTLPRLTINLFSGGKHAGGQVCVQDVLIVPTAGTIDEGLASAFPSTSPRSPLSVANTRQGVDSGRGRPGAAVSDHRGDAGRRGGSDRTRGAAARQRRCSGDRCGGDPLLFGQSLPIRWPGSGQQGHDRCAVRLVLALSDGEPGRRVSRRRLGPLAAAPKSAGIRSAGGRRRSALYQRGSRPPGCWAAGGKRAPA